MCPVSAVSKRVILRILKYVIAYEDSSHGNTDGLVTHPLLLIGSGVDTRGSLPSFYVS